MKNTDKLTHDQLAAIRQFYIDGKPIGWIAEQFGISRVTVNNHSKTRFGHDNKTWRQLREIKANKDQVNEETKFKQEADFEKQESKAEKRDKRLSDNEKLRRKWLRQTIKEVDGKLRMPKLKPSEYIALSKYRLELENELVGKDEIIIIGAPREFPDDI